MGLCDALMPLLYGVRTVARIPTAFHENKQLTAQVIELQQALVSKSEAEGELKRLRVLLGYKEQTGWNMLACKVVGLAPGAGVKGMVINSGSSDGIKENQPVITANGIVGRVQHVGLLSSTILLITDPKLGVAGKLLRTRENGIVHSSGGERLNLDGIPITAKVEIGDTLITSGMDRVFPRGLMIGTVSNTQPDPNGWLLDVEVTSSVDMGSVEDIFVVTDMAEMEGTGVPVRP